MFLPLKYSGLLWLVSMHRRRRLNPMFHFYTFMSSITSFKYFHSIGFVLNVKHIYKFGNAISWNYLFTNLFVSLLHVFDTLWFMYLFDWALLSLYFIFYFIYFYHFILFHFLVFSISKRVVQTWWFFFFFIESASDCTCANLLGEIYVTSTNNKKRQTGQSGLGGGETDRRSVWGVNWWMIVSQDCLTSISGVGAVNMAVLGSW